MSGGVVVVLPAATLAPAALAVVAAGAAAAMAIQAVKAGTEATGRALEQFADEMERQANAQDDLEIRTRLWELAAGSVVRTNQDLLLLAARAEKAGVRLTLPRSIDLTGCRLADTPGLVARAQDELAKARALVERAEAERERQVLLARLSVPAGSGPSAEELLARHQQVLARRERLSASAPAEWVLPRKVDESRVQAEIDAILSRLHEDATADDRAEALVAAARVERKKNAAMSRTYLEALARTVQKEINPRIARRREAANLLAALEQPLVAEVIGDFAPPRPPCFDAIERLRAVVRGEADLTAEDRHDAQSALDRVQVELDRRRLLDGVAEAFGGLGYSVTVGLQVGHSPALSVTRRTWHGEHAADVWVDNAGRVQSRLVQVAREATGEASRCADLNDSLRHVNAELNRRGIDARVYLPDPPNPALKRFARDSFPPMSRSEDEVQQMHARDLTEEE